MSDGAIADCRFHFTLNRQSQICNLQSLHQRMPTVIGRVSVVMPLCLPCM